MPLAAASVTIPLASSRCRRLALWGLLAALLAGGSAGCSQRIKWYPDYSQAQPMAQRDNRPMLLYFWDWLSRDRARMEMQVFSDPRVVAAMRRTVNVRLEQGWFRDRARQYDVRSVPTFVLTNPDGLEQSRLTGVPTPEVFVDWLQAALRQPPASQPSGNEAAPTTQPESPGASAPGDAAGPEM